MLCGGVVIGAIIMAAVFSISSNADAESGTACPENIGQIEDPSGYSIFTFGTCGSDFVVVPSVAGRYDLQVVSDEMLGIMGTGTAEVMGERINFDMGDEPDVDAWFAALNQATT